MSLNFIPRGPINNKPALGQIIEGKKPLSKTMTTKLTSAYTSLSISLNLSVQIYTQLYRDRRQNELGLYSSLIVHYTNNTRRFLGH